MLLVISKCITIARQDILKEGETNQLSFPTATAKIITTAIDTITTIGTNNIASITAITPALARVVAVSVILAVLW